MRKTRPRSLSTIEMTVLGLTWGKGPCSTYTVMRELESSLSTYYKSRAGTTYSVMHRLTGLGYIESDEGLVKVTDAGVKALQGWLTPPIPTGDVGHSADLVRLRSYFLGVLDRDSRIAFVDAAIEALRAHLARCEALAETGEYMDIFDRLAFQSVLYETRARIAWMEWMKAELESM